MKDTGHTHRIRVCGLRPIDKEINSFLIACDLGLEGGCFVPFDVTVTVTLKATATMQAAANAIVAGYGLLGCCDVQVMEIFANDSAATAHM